MYQCAGRVEKSSNVRGMPEICQKGARRIEYGWWHIERGWGASNKVGGALKVAGSCRKWPGCVESGRVVSKVAGLCRRWPGHTERGRELLEGWEYVGGCVGLVEWGGARQAGAGVCQVRLLVFATYQSRARGSNP